MTALNKQALRGQSVGGSFYLVECCNCGEMYPSNLLDGGEAIADSGDYGDCYCHLCGADDTERADFGDVNSNEAKAWNFQQKRIEALLDELEAAEKRNDELETYTKTTLEFREAALSENRHLKLELEIAEKRIAELEARQPYGYLRQCDGQIQISIGSERPHDRSGGYATPWFAIYTAAGIGVKGE
ncbi:hypothetical protein DQR93_11030 [Salmonella enterica subsp. enterica serovar Bovismorbificans]|nr:hypothetical protein [Salmonella enterica]EBU9534322.1 hypothetical protein [Salmonella enterica subsp. enterica serovar Bovismorbificans]EAN8346103.1 hypothetical protein [Salmonella enterica]EAR5411800.1 hypothetical protein [Salmonella enterica]EAV4645828.1 hypothetical protein [Salmonella enterica]